MINSRTDKRKIHGTKRRGFCRKIMGVLFQIWVYIRSAFDHVIDYLFGLYYDSKRKYIPKCKNKLITQSATSLAKKIRTGELKSEDVVQAYIDRIKEVNDILNAVVDSRFEEALEEARQIDRDIKSGKISQEEFNKRPFLGVPFTTKDTAACKGLSNTFGLVARKGIKANDDADVIVSMKQAGAILLGVTNVPQLNLWTETFNPVYGTTNNPYNTTRCVGGSSGGEASIVAACGSAFGLGTDIGGSIRIPCFMCGLFGHKPSPDLISTKGLTFRTGKEKETMVVSGPITRHTEDLIPILKVLLGKNVSKLNLDKKINVGDLKIYFIKDPEDPYCSSIREEMSQIFQKVIDYFESNGNKTEKVRFEETRRGGKLWRYWMTQEGTNFKSEIINKEGEVNTYLEILKFVFRCGDFTAPVIFNLLNNYVLPQENEKWARETTEKLKSKLIKILGDDGVLLYPSAPWPASYHYTALLRPWNFNFFSIWNALNMPVTQVPLGLSKDGLPMGIQVVASPSQDHLCIAIARELEKAFGGYVPPFKVE